MKKIKRRRIIDLERKKAYQGLIFVSPFIIGFLVFFAYPIIESFRYSFSTMQFRGVIKNMTFAGFSNYTQMFVLDPEFMPNFSTSLFETLIYTPLIVIISLILAIVLNKGMKGRAIFRGIFFLPFILGSGFVMKLLLGLGTEQGEIDFFRGIVLTADMEQMFGPSISATINSVLRVIVLVLWKSGLQILLFLAGLQGISTTLMESAKVDGANEWVFFWKITLPMLSPVILINIIYTIVASFSDATNLMLSYIIKVGTEQFEYTYAAALSWVYFAVMLLIIGIVFLCMSRVTLKSDRG